MFDTEIIILDDDREEIKLLKEIIHQLREIRRRLEPTFRLSIYQISQGRLTMAAITAGQSGTFLLSATASDNSTPVLAGQTLTADDASVTVAQDTTDASGNTFTVTVPASDTATTFNLAAKAEVTSNTSPTPQTVTATLAVTISPAATPVTFTLSINEK